jgi:hypothetical protein
MNGGLLKAAGHGAIAALAGVLLSAGSAQAADLGGNCCADLEERIAELEATTVRKGNRRVSLTLSGHVNRSILYWDDGFTSDIYSVDNAISNSRFRMTGTATISADLSAGFYVEFSMALGARSHQVTQFDDDGFAGAGGIIGGQFGDGIGGAGDSVLDFNQANWFLTSKHWGKLTVGRLATTTAGIGVIDLSNTGIVANSQPFLWGGGFILRNDVGALGIGQTAAGTPDAGTALVWGRMCGGPNPGGSGGPYSVDCGIHALSRRDAVMYTTPTWHGFTFGASWGEDDFYDVSGRYAGEWHGFRFAGGLGYRWYGDREADDLFFGPPDRQVNDTDRRHWLTSASLMHVATGLFVSGTWTQYQFHGDNVFERFDADPFGRNRPDVDLWWVDAGIQKNWTGWGATTFYAEYGRVTDGITGLNTDRIGGLEALGAEGVVVNSNFSWWGVGVVQKVDAAAMELYLAYRRYSGSIRLGDSEEAGDAIQIDGGLEDIWYIQAGARIQF